MEEKKEKKKSGLGTAGMILGIVGVCTSFIPIINNLSFVCGVVGFILALISLCKKASIGQSIAGIVLCIFACVFTISAQNSLSQSLNEWSSDIDKWAGNSTEKILAEDIDVAIGDFKTKTTYGFTETELPVTITNKTNNKQSFSVQIEAVKSDGTRIDTDTVYASNLNGGQSQELKAFTLVTSDKVSDLKNATFKILEVSEY